MTRRKTAPAAAVQDPSAEEPWSRYCGDCVPPLHIQGGDWGWRAHRHQLHGEAEPGPYPYPCVDRGPAPGSKPWTDAQRADFHRRRAAAARKARHTPAPRAPRPTGGHYPAGPR